MVDNTGEDEIEGIPVEVPGICDIVIGVGEGALEKEPAVVAVGP